MTYIKNRHEKRYDRIKSKTSVPKNYVSAKNLSICLERSGHTNLLRDGWLIDVLSIGNHISVSFIADREKNNAVTTVKIRDNAFRGTKWRDGTGDRSLIWIEYLTSRLGMRKANRKIKKVTKVRFSKIAKISLRPIFYSLGNKSDKKFVFEVLGISIRIRSKSLDLFTKAKV